MFSLSTNRKAKGERRRLGPGVITGRFVNKYALVHFRCDYLEVDLDDMRSANRLLEVLGRDGEFQLHLPSAKSPIRYSVGSQTLIFLSEMRNAISNRNKTTRTNTDARTSPRAFYEPTHNREIAIREMGGVGAFNDSTERLCNVGV